MSYLFEAKEENDSDENMACLSAVSTARGLYVKIISAHILKYFFPTEGCTLTW